MFINNLPEHDSLRGLSGLADDEDREEPGEADEPGAGGRPAPRGAQPEDGRGEQRRLSGNDREKSAN